MAAVQLHATDAGADAPGRSDPPGKPTCGATGATPKGDLLNCTKKPVIGACDEFENSRSSEKPPKADDLANAALTATPPDAAVAEQTSCSGAAAGAEPIIKSMTSLDGADEGPPMSSMPMSRRSTSLDCGAACAPFDAEMASERPPSASSSSTASSKSSYVSAPPGPSSARASRSKNASVGRWYTLARVAMRPRRSPKVSGSKAKVSSAMLGLSARTTALAASGFELSRRQ
mmetsp:Transcript_10054/g.33219  ORF Transcript_10054/g.33219 Transcript_10054/m.33219 type:complete len:231 (-) Transcript_10054:1801-2493(-)